MKADADREHGQSRRLLIGADRRHRLAEPEAKHRRVEGMRPARLRHAGGGHVGVADRLQLLHAALGEQLVEAEEVAIEVGDELAWRERLGRLREAHEVGEEHRHVVKVPRLALTGVGKLVGDSSREDLVE